MALKRNSGSGLESTLAIALLDDLPDAAQLRGDFTENRGQRFRVFLRFDRMPCPAHARVQEVADGDEIQQALEHHFRAGAAARGLNLDARKTQPSFDDVGSELDVLDP